MRAFILFAALPLFACSASPSDAPPQVDQEALTDIPQSQIKKQATGTCWIFTTAAWIESVTNAGPTVWPNVSEAYITYFSWLERLQKNDLVKDDAGALQVRTDGYVGEGFELARRRGLMREADFGVTAEMTAAAAREVAVALAPGGELDTKAKRGDAHVVRRVLDRGFRLSPTVKSAMTRAFGQDLARTLDDGVELPPSITAPAAIVVGFDGDRAVTLADAIGAPVRGDETFRHRGAYAWSDVEIGVDEPLAATTLRMKSALNAGFPVPIYWTVAAGHASPDDVSFHAARQADVPIPDAAHESLIDDYAVRLANGEVLPLGRAEERPDALASTLDEESHVEVVRAKNSWGFTRYGAPVGADDHRGYVDLEWRYLVPTHGTPRLGFLWLPGPAFRNVRPARAKAR